MLSAQMERAIQTGQLDLTTRPRDKRDHYVKRAVGLPGERLEIKNREVFIDGSAVKDPENIQFSYVLDPAPTQIKPEWSDWVLSAEDPHGGPGRQFRIFLSQ